MVDKWFDGLLELNVWGLDGGCNGCDGLVELLCEGRMVDKWFDGLLELNVWGLEGGCNGCDGLLELTV